MNVIEMLADSAKNNHGREFHPGQIKEIVGIMQSQQYEYAELGARYEALTRIVAVALSQLGGTLDIQPEVFADAEQWVTDVVWDEEEDGGVIHVASRLADLGLPEVQEGIETARDSEGDSLPVQEHASGQALDRGDNTDEAQE